MPHPHATRLPHLALALAAAVSLPGAAASAGMLTPDASREGREALVWNAKMTCGTTEQGVTRYGMWEGKLYSRAPGERDKVVFTVIGINTRQCARMKDPQRGEGFRSVSREIMV